MHLKYKFVLFWIILICAFSASAVLLVLDATGYKIDWKNHSFIKTSILYIAAQPEDSAVTVDNELVSHQLPVRLSQLLPGRYDVEINKPNYISWSRTVDLVGGYATELEDIILFLEKPVITKGTESDSEILGRISPPGDLRVNDFEIYRIVNDIPILVTRLSQTVKQVIWYPDRTHIAYQVDNEIRIIETTGQADLLLIKLETSDPVIMTFIDNGRILLIKQSDHISRVTVR